MSLYNKHQCVFRYKQILNIKDDLILSQFLLLGLLNYHNLKILLIVANTTHDSCNYELYINFHKMHKGTKYNTKLLI